VVSESNAPEAAPTLAEMKEAIRELDPAAMDDDPEMLDAGLVVLAGLNLGTRRIMPISRFTGVPPRQVAEFAERLRANGVWSPEGKTALNAHDDGVDIELLLHILVATGMVECRPAYGPGAGDEPVLSAAGPSPQPSAKAGG